MATRRIVESALSKARSPGQMTTCPSRPSSSPLRQSLALRWPSRHCPRCNPILQQRLPCRRSLPRRGRQTDEFDQRTTHSDIRPGTVDMVPLLVTLKNLDRLVEPVADELCPTSGEQKFIRFGGFHEHVRAGRNAVVRDSERPGGERPVVSFGETADFLFARLREHDCVLPLLVVASLGIELFLKSLNSRSVYHQDAVMEDLGCYEV